MFSLLKHLNLVLVGPSDRCLEVQALLIELGWAAIEAGVVHVRRRAGVACGPRMMPAGLVLTEAGVAFDHREGERLEFFHESP